MKNLYSVEWNALHLAAMPDGKVVCEGKLPDLEDVYAGRAHLKKVEPPHEANTAVSSANYSVIEAIGVLTICLARSNRLTNKEFNDLYPYINQLLAKDAT